MLVYFPTFVLSVDTSANCHLSYEPLGCSAPLSTLHYFQPWCAPNLYPSEVSPSTCMVTPAPALAIVEDDECLLMYAPQIPVHSSPALPLTPGGSSMDVSSIAVQLWALADMVNSLMSSSLATSERLPPSLCSSTSESSPTTHDAPNVTLNHVSLLSAMPQESIIKLLHHESSKLPSICPCNTANNSDTKTHWSAEEIHRIMGCHKFWNYKHILQVSHDGEWVDGGEFPPSLGSFATIPKSHHSGPLDRTKYKYLDAVHMGITFGDCLSIGRFCYALILVDCTTRYNWTFGLKTLTLDSILSALCLFRASAGSLARRFYSDCDVKLFGTAISEYLINSNSKVVAAPAKCQSSNSLVESHWKTMVHMGHSRLPHRKANALVILVLRHHQCCVHDECHSRQTFRKR
jgi:hypothetical protein